MIGKTFLLDCTLRDGGYINDWNFGEKAIESIIQKLAQTGIEMIEIGFLKGDKYDPDKTLFPDIKSCEKVLNEKNSSVKYVGMIDMNNPIPIERITENNGKSIDGIRVIFKKDKIEEAYNYCEHIKKMGYELFVNFVNTDYYTDKEFIDGIEKYNSIDPTGITIVDTFGTIKRKAFLRLVAIADHNLNKNIMLCYHAHNNLQQAFGNAEALVEMNLSRDVCIDACVFGMGRGAGNLNLELFAEFMNENRGCSYRISPMLEIMDEYLNDYYRTKYWGYSLPLYLSASFGCHPNYAVYLAKKNTLSEKAFSELLKSITEEDKMVFSVDRAEKYYAAFMDKYIDDSETLMLLKDKFKGKEVLLIAPGNTIKNNKEKILYEIKENVIVVCVNFYDKAYTPEYVFVGNNRRFKKIINNTNCSIICTSNVFDYKKANYIINYSSFTGKNNAVFDNSGLMLLRLLAALGVKKLKIAGMDGYSKSEADDYYHEGFGTYPLNKMYEKNSLVSEELKKIRKHIDIQFVTPSRYDI